MTRLVGRANRDVVEGLVGHAAGQGPVADHGHRPVVGMGQGVAERIGERGGGMAVLDEVVGAFLPARIARHAPVFAKAAEPFHAAGDELVDIGLVADVPDDPVVRAVEGPVQGDGQLDHSEVGAEMATGPRDLVNQKLADLLAEFDQLGIVQLAQIGGPPDSGEKRSHNRTGYRPSE